jgi:hypothetical protein
MELRGEQAYKLVWRLESGRGRDPSIGTIARFLRACGARWYQFCDVLEPVETADVPMPEAARELLPERAIERVEAAVRD